MASVSAKIDGIQMAKSVTVNIVLTHAKELGLRIWLTNKLLRLAQFVSPFEINVTRK